MINGIVNVYKESGFTSFDVVAKMRGIFHQKKLDIPEPLIRTHREYYLCVWGGQQKCVIF